MTDMSDPAVPPSEPVYLVLARKLILLILLMIVAALGLVTLLRHLQLASLLLPLILSDATMGLVAGLSTRLILRKQNVFLRIAAIPAFLVGGLELLGWFTGWQVGLGPLKFGNASMDWFGLGQLFLGTSIALLALYAWTRPTPTVASPTSGSESIENSPHTRQEPEEHPRRPARPRVRPESAAITKKPIQTKRKRPARRKPQLHLSDEEEHRCPYCLELIDPDDPRGTVECKICHTLHHADCWAITGACQVPHYIA
jgi:hypothetical protein